MNETGHDRWSDDLVAYMLGALEPGEAAELERHLEGCERCRSELRWLTPAVRALPEGVEQVEPPRRLRERVMTEVRAEAREAGVRPESAAGGYRNRAASWLRRLGSGAHGWRSATAIAAVALVAVALAGYEIGNVGAGNDRGTSTVVSGQAPGVTATMIRDGDSGTLRLANVHQLPSDKVLEAWVQRDGEVEPVRALFVPDREGRASTMIADMEGIEVVMVTAEPKGGSEAPTSKPIVTMTVE